MRIQVQKGDENQQTSAGKPPIYALGELKWGAFRDVEDQLSKYWIWGPLKPYMAYLFLVYQNLTWSCKAQLRYTLPCEGCRECANLVKNSIGTGQQQQQQNSRWWHVFIPRTRTSLTSISLLNIHIHIIKSKNYFCTHQHKCNINNNYRFQNRKGLFTDHQP